MSDKKFRFWFPIDNMSKGKDEAGEVEMKFGGYASTTRKDIDGEHLDPSGFDLSYFNERGIVNWNHGKTPETIIGEPIEAKIKNNKLWVSTKLYNRSDLAKNVYTLGQTLEKSGATRRLGYSIEGIVTERDPINPAKVKKALITNMAITLNPKNPDSIIDIIKGTFNEFTEETDATAEELLKQVSNGGANGGTQYIIDITRPDGYRITVDCQYKIKIIKALDTENGKALIKEDVDNKLIDLNKISSKKRYLSKGQVFDKIFDKFGVIDLTTANKIFNKINTNMKKNQKEQSTNLADITEEVLEKALDAMSDSLDETTKPILKKGVDDANDAIETDDDDDENEEEEEETPKPKAKGKPFEKKGGDKMEKGLDSSALAIVLKGINNKLNEMNKRFDTMEKAIESQDELLNEIADSSPAPKSITKSATKPLQREFEKGIVDEFEKGIDDENGVKTVSVSKQKHQILGILDNMAFNQKEGFNPVMAKALTSFESAGTLEKGIVDEINKFAGIQLVN